MRADALLLLIANAGMEHIKKGNVEDAIAALTEALDLSPGHPSAADLLYNRGSMYKKAGQLDAGEKLAPWRSQWTQSWNVWL
eukprot:SAG31_NODE_1014_length_10366_cov_2.357129_5_plen_82_part_00